MRVVFVGNEASILKALDDRADLVGVYCYKPRFSLKKFRLWLLGMPWVRFCITGISRRWPYRLKGWQRSLPRFQIFDQAKIYGYPIIQADSINSKAFIQQLEELNVDLGIVANFGEILNAEVLRSTKFGFINFHPSLLPSYRGPEPIPHILINGETKTGVTWHKVSQKIDGGDIVSQELMSIEDDDTVKSILDRSIDLAITQLYEIIALFEGGLYFPRPQSGQGSYFPKLSKAQKNAIRNKTALDIRLSYKNSRSIKN